MPTCEDITDFGVLKIKNSNVCGIHGPFFGDGSPCPTLFDARSNSAPSAWDTHTILGTLTYVDGDSTLDFTEEGNVPRTVAQPNVTIAGVHTDPDGEGSQIANRKYVDDELTGVIHLHPSVMQRVSTLISGFSPYSYNGSTIGFIVPQVAPWAFDNGASTVTYDSVVINVGVTDRVLFTDNTGGAANYSNGVYTLTSIAISGAAVFTRATDLAEVDQLKKGEMVIVDSSLATGTSDDEGIGYILQENVVSLSATVQNWDEHHGQVVQLFDPILYNDGANNVHCKGAGAGDDDKPVVGGAVGTEGVALIQPSVSVGKPAANQAFVINAAVFTLTDLGTTTLTGTGAASIIKFNAQGGTADVKGAAGGTTITLEGNALRTETNFSADTHKGSKVVGGTIPGVIGTLDYATVKDNGHFTAYTHTLTVGTGAADSGRIGAGLLFDSALPYGGGNTNCNSFLLAPRSLDIANTADLSLFKFATTGSGAGSILLSFSVP